MSERDWLKEIIGTPLTSISYESHPADDVLRDYIQGRLDRSGPLDTAGLRAGNLTIWHRTGVTAHLLTCRRCVNLVAELRAAPSGTPAPNWLKAFFDRLLLKREAVPALARSIMVAQFVIIVGLVGVIYFKPVPLFPPQNPVASILPPPEATKPQLQSPQLPQSPQPQEMALPSPTPSNDPIPQLIQTLQSTDVETQIQAAEALGRAEDPRAVEALTVALGGNDPRLRETASRALEQIWQRTETRYQQIQRAFNDLRARGESLQFFITDLLEDIPEESEEHNSYPHTVHVIFREDTPVREIEGLVQSVSGMLVWTDEGGFVIKIPMAAGKQLDSIVQKLSQNPYVIEARKD